MININDTIRKTVGKKLTLFSLVSYFQSRSVTLNEHQALAINEYELAKLERNQKKVRYSSLVIRQQTRSLLAFLCRQREQ